MERNKIITISREFGSGGRTIGKEVAERLKIPCYDQELIEKVQKESGFTQEFIRENGEYAKGNEPGLIFCNDYLWLAQRRVIIELAQKGPCVIVGRCADYILRDRARLLTVFVHADMKSRAERIVKLYGERDASPEKRLKEKDRRRAAYYRYYTDMEWGNVGNYTLALDSGILGIDRCVDLIVGLY